MGIAFNESELTLAEPNCTHRGSDYPFTVNLLNGLCLFKIESQGEHRRKEVANMAELIKKHVRPPWAACKCQ